MQLAKSAFFGWLLTFPGFALAQDEESPFTPDRLHALHAKMDADANGKVSMEEILQTLHSHRKSNSANNSPEQLEEKDADKDGKLSLDELVKQQMAELPPGEETKGMEETPEMLEAQEQYQADHRAREGMKFNAADLDNDGLLDAMELAAFNSPETHDHILEITTKWAIDGRDHDRDGFLTFDEFNGPPVEAGNQTGPEFPDSESNDGSHYNGYHEPEDDDDREDGEGPEGPEGPYHPPDPSIQHTEENLQTFKKLDKDGNGKLDLKEMFDYESGHIYTRKAMDHFMQVADVNKDGHVTVDELQASHMWERSDAKYYLMEMIPKVGMPSEEKEEL